MFVQRLCQPETFQASLFLFGPRMTGKTTILQKMKSDLMVDLLDPELELQYRANPRLFWEQFSALPRNSVVIVDEVQKVPELLNYIQMGIDRMDHVFIMSGSSARKLKRGGANLLGGRALNLKLHPFAYDEISGSFSIDKVLQWGTLPKIYLSYTLGTQKQAIRFLSSYVTTYIKEEIQAEALTRNIGSFQRFLSIAAQSNGQIIAYSDISRSCSVPTSTVKEYYQILEDTLIGFFLPPYARSERKKARSKSYFFDCGVVRAIQNRLIDPPTPRELGFLFETWMVNELMRIRDYGEKSHEFSFWRERDHEIDLIVSDGQNQLLAIECKSGQSDLSAMTVNRFRVKFPGLRLVVASLNDRHPRRIHGIDVLPWMDVLMLYKSL